jgi:3',5'-cyclic AMP phosphodiesterase CpdA
MRTIVHLSDLHFGRLDPLVVPALVTAVNGLSPNLIVISGDFTQRATEGQFVEARDFLAQLAAPQLAVPGNHDVPLFDLGARFFAPFTRYRRYIADDLSPVFEDDEMIVVGLNSARSVSIGGAGRVNAQQVERAAGHLMTAAPGLVKVVVTHHPFDVPAGQDERQLIGRSEMAMTRLAEAGADVFMAGHLHVTHVCGTATRYRIAGHSALVVQAGTLSTRQRGEASAFNVLTLGDAGIDVERYEWVDATGAFLPAPLGAFCRRDGGWAPR